MIQVAKIGSEHAKWEEILLDSEWFSIKHFMMQTGIVLGLPITFPGKRINNGCNYLLEPALHYLFPPHPTPWVRSRKKVLRKALLRHLNPSQLESPSIGSLINSLQNGNWTAKL